MGMPAVFVRSSLCNLHCIWCDTDYTWNWTGTRFEHRHDVCPGYRKFDKKKWIAGLPVEAVAALVAEIPCRNIVLTGGEPMLQQEALVALIRRLRQISPGYRFEVETNGTLLPLPEFDQAVDQYNVSPKLENSNNPRKLREKPVACRFFAQSPKAYFKFVVAEKNDLEEVLELKQRYALLPEKIMLMPEGSTRQLLARRRRWIVEVCKANGFYYTDRLKVQIWGSKKGV